LRGYLLLLPLGRAEAGLVRCRGDVSRPRSRGQSG
jgi:hypothetical protein